MHDSDDNLLAVVRTSTSLFRTSMLRKRIIRQAFWLHIIGFRLRRARADTISPWAIFCSLWTAKQRKSHRFVQDRTAGMKTNRIAAWFGSAMLISVRSIQNFFKSMRKVYIAFPAAVRVKMENWISPRLQGF